MCINSHDLDDCRNFNGVEVEGRSKFLSNQKLWVLQKISQSYTAAIVQFKEPARYMCW